MSPDDEFQSVRRDLCAVVDAVVQTPQSHGRIFPENIQSADSIALGLVADLKNLWMTWINEASFNVAYIPPEAFAEIALPNSTGNTSKADSWALGCLTIWYINIDQPLKLVRHLRFALGVEVFKMEQPLLPKLQALYAGAGQEKNLVIGPKIELIRPVPCACEDFLSHCLELDPAKRWSLEQLRLHPFLDLSKSVDDLLTMDTAYYQQTLPFKEMFTVTKVQKHPYLRSDDVLMTHQIGELVYKTPGNRPPQPVDILHFGIHPTGEMPLQKHRDLWTKAFGKLGEALAMEASTDARTKEWANVYRMRALQDGNKNIVQHFGCQFVEQGNSALPLEIQIFSEHCAGGSLKDAAEYHLPMDIIAKWTREALQGLNYLHGHRIVHRNINSGVILFSEANFKGTIKIGGCQYMRQLETDRTEQHAVSARQGHDGRFAAPEIVNSYTEDINVGRKCDIWSFGCVLLHLLSGAPPLYAGSKDQPMLLEMAILYHLNSANKKLPRIYDWIPNKAQKFIETCLKFNPLERPAAAELLQKMATEKWEMTGPEDAQYLANRKGEELPSGVAEYWRSYV